MTPTVLTSSLHIGPSRSIKFYLLGSHSDRALPLIYLHGAPSCGLEALPLHAAAATAGVRIISFDRPGWGDTPPDPSITYESFSRDYVAALADHLRLPRFVVAGTSGGSRLALAVGRFLPDRTLRVVQIGSTGPYHGPWLSAYYRPLPSGWGATVLDPLTRALLRLDRAAASAIAPPLRWISARLAPTATGSGEVDDDDDDDHEPVALDPATLQPVQDGRPAPAAPDQQRLPLFARLALPLIFAPPDVAAIRALADRGELAPFLASAATATRQGPLCGTLADAVLQCARPAAQFDVRDLSPRVGVLLLHGAADVNCPVASCAESFRDVVYRGGSGGVGGEGVEVRVYEGEGHISVLLNRAEELVAAVKESVEGMRW
ncbi:Alpha/Beta hydrolase protein [Zopfochytrium polystomum]|nr:Alpha/Beta hydrolase protein [Zopfochytrium polystomum]